MGGDQVRVTLQRPGHHPAQDGAGGGVGAAQPSVRVDRRQQGRPVPDGSGGGAAAVRSDEKLVCTDGGHDSPIPVRTVRTKQKKRMKQTGWTERTGPARRRPRPGRGAGPGTRATSAA
jgi:hypothetical protein